MKFLPLTKRSRAKWPEPKRPMGEFYPEGKWKYTGTKRQRQSITMPRRIQVLSIQVSNINLIFFYFLPQKLLIFYFWRMLLWHGSRMSNWFSILSQGLRIAPPEAPCTGYMFGKGVYFADSSSKSSNYCFPTKTKNVGLAVLCDVSSNEK